MAYYGLSCPIIARYKLANGLESYTEGFRCGKAVGTDITPNYNEATLFGDNQAAEYVKEFKDADVTLNVTTLPVVALTVMFGHETKESSAEVGYKAGDQSAYCGYGFYASEMIGGETTFIACFMPKVKFAEGAESYTTKGDSIEFKTPTLSGKAAADEKGYWKYKKTFTAEEEAVEWLMEKVGMTAPSGGEAKAVNAEVKSTK